MSRAKAWKADAAYLLGTGVGHPGSGPSPATDLLFVSSRPFPVLSLSFPSSQWGQMETVMLPRLPVIKRKGNHMYVFEVFGT